VVERQDKPVMDRFQEWAASHQSKPVVNRAEFLRVRDDVQIMLSNNLSVRNIWAFLTAEGRITYGLSSFNRDVRRLVTKVDQVPSSSPAKSAPVTIVPPRSPAPASPAATPPAPTDPPPVEPAAEPRPKPTRFHKPDDPQKEDYI
jgi:hypothetical protein